MALTKTTKIANLKRVPSTGLVTEVTYIMNFSLESETDRKVGTIELQGDVNDPEFVLYENLTEEIVDGWVTQALGQETITAIETEFETRLQARIDAKTNPQYLTGTPWNG
jgi:hypothetical protein